MDSRASKRLIIIKYQSFFENFVYSVGSIQKIRADAQIASLGSSGSCKDWSDIFLCVTQYISLQLVYYVKWAMLSLCPHIVRLFDEQEVLIALCAENGMELFNGTTFS